MPENPYGSFTAVIQGCVLSIHPEMVPAKEGISPSGRYFVYCIHPSHGSLYFFIEQDQNAAWRSEVHPPFISKAFIRLVGRKIELRSR